MNKIEITVLSARVLDALSGRGLKAKTVHEFERYGTRRIVKHCLGKGQILYSKETVQNFVWNERAKQEKRKQENKLYIHTWDDFVCVRPDGSLVHLVLE